MRVHIRTQRHTYCKHTHTYIKVYQQAKSFFYKEKNATKVKSGSKRNVLKAGLKEGMYMHPSFIEVRF